MSHDWNFDPAGTAVLDPAGPKPTPRRFRKVLRREQETLESLRPGAATEEAETPPAQDGRDTRGRFTKGNKGGTGNPFARQIAGFRTALVSAATDEDFADLARMLLAKAKGGDLAAVKLFLSYTIGKPTDAPDPDRLDLEDFQLLRARLGPLEEDWHQIRTMVPVEGITEAGHRVADLRAECWREEVLRPAAAHEVRLSAADAAVQAREEAELEEELAAEETAEAAPASAEAETAAFIREVLRTLNATTETSLAVLKGESVPPSANGGAAASAPSANGDTVAHAPSRNGVDGGHAPSANGDNGSAARSRRQR